MARLEREIRPWQSSTTAPHPPEHPRPSTIRTAEAGSQPEPASADSSPHRRRRAGAAPATREVKESLIAADLTIEGKIEGAGHVRIAGRFKGDVNVQGDLTIENGAKVNGGVRASKVIIAGELEGNIESAHSASSCSESGVLIGDLKAGSLTVAAGSRMRGQVEFGWDDKDRRQVGQAARRRPALGVMSAARPGTRGRDAHLPALQDDDPRKRQRLSGVPAPPALRRSRDAAARRPTISPLQVEGTIRHPPGDDAVGILDGAVDPRTSAARKSPPGGRRRRAAAGRAAHVHPGGGDDAEAHRQQRRGAGTER